MLGRKIGAQKNETTLLIVHRVQDGRMSERLTVLPTYGSGPGDEFVRNGNESIGYYPRKKSVVVQERNRSYGFLRAFNGLSERSAREYVLTDRGSETVEGRVAQHVSLEPRDALRYGYQFWLDPGTALPLKTQIVARFRRACWRRSPSGGSWCPRRSRTAAETGNRCQQVPLACN